MLTPEVVIFDREIRDVSILTTVVATIDQEVCDNL